MQKADVIIALGACFDNRVTGKVDSRVWCYNGKVLSSSPSQIHLIYHYLLDLFYDTHYSHSQMTNSDFACLAQAMGVHTIQCSNPSELGEKMKEYVLSSPSSSFLTNLVVQSYHP